MAPKAHKAHRERLSREEILEALSDALLDLDYVDAMWEGGAAAYRRVDAWSDLDLYVVVRDDKVDDAFGAIEDVLSRISHIETKFPVAHPPASGIAQAFYRLETASPYLLVDLAVLKRSAPDKYLEPEIHGRAVFSIDKTGLSALPPLDAEAFVAKLMERLERLRGRFDTFAVFVQKELNRRNWMEALDSYRVIVLDSLVEVLRMRYGPLHYGFRTRYVHKELPRDVVKRLESLFFVKDVEDLKAKYEEASGWFREVADGIREVDVRALVPRAKLPSQ